MFSLQVLPLKINEKTESRHLKDTDSRQIHRIAFTTVLQPRPDRRVILYILNCLSDTEKIYNIKIKNINVTRSPGNKYFYKFKTTNDEIVNSMFCSNVLLRFSVIAPAALPANAPRHIFHR